LRTFDRHFHSALKAKTGAFSVFKPALWAFHY